VPKNAEFLKELLKGSWGSVLNPRWLSAPSPDPRVATTACCCSTLSSAFLVLNAFYYCRKTNVATVDVLHLKLFFTSNSAVLLIGAQNIFLLQVPYLRH